MKKHLDFKNQNLDFKIQILNFKIQKSDFKIQKLDFKIHFWMAQGMNANTKSEEKETYSKCGAFFSDYRHEH